MKKPILKNNSGFVVAEFLFAFVMVLGIGIFIFALSFSLATVEISQYIIWATARNFAAANTSEDVARDRARDKYDALIKKFPMLTGAGADSPWFRLDSPDEIVIGDLTTADTEADFQALSSDDKANSFRQPWIGARTILNLKLFAGLQVPFLGKVADSPDAFKMPIRAFLIRHPSQVECQNFFYSQRYPLGVRKLEGGNLGTGQPDLSENLPGSGSSPVGLGEDNGC